MSKIDKRIEQLFIDAGGEIHKDREFQDVYYLVINRGNFVVNFIPKIKSLIEALKEKDNKETRD